MKKQSLSDWFSRVSRTGAEHMGHPIAFVLALLVIAMWALTGPLFHFSDTWQLVINTGTTVVTFLMVFLIQNTQNRDAKAIQLKLDELLRAVESAHNALLSIEELPDDDLNQLKERYDRLAQQAREDARRGRRDTGSPHVRLAKPGKRPPVEVK